jgi:ABC-type dipeptide/oligopeptide/nickel transport system ATPase subunit/GNAT superfamily N-acetyltransferase
VEPSARVAEVSLKFGVDRGGSEARIVGPVDVNLQPGQIVLFLGPSGSGKTTALRQIQDHFSAGVSVQRVRFPRNNTIVDAVASHGTLTEALELLSASGLGEPRLWIRRIDELSDGERFRARLARAVGLHARSRGEVPLVCDEFCTGLHRRAAKAVAFNLRKLITRRNLTIALASSHEDIVEDLQPDTVVHLLGCGRHTKVMRPPCETDISFANQLIIERGSKRDYDEFAAMHYRVTDELGFVDKVFVIREGPCGDRLGIVVYAHGPLELSMRNQATNGKYVRNPTAVNRDFRILRRLVVHPDVRGCGIGHRLVRETLAKVGTRYVECLAAMGAVNPVFEKAGMRRIGTCPMPKSRTEIIKELRHANVDPWGPEFVHEVSRKRRIRRIVARFVYQWYQATTAGGERRVARQSPQALAMTCRGLLGAQPVYYIWESHSENRKRLRSA